MENKNDQRFRNTIRAFIVLAFVGGFSVTSAAQPIAAQTAFDRFMERSTGAGKQTVEFGRDGTPLAAPGVPTVNTDGGLPRVDTSGSVRNPSGNAVPVTATSRVPAAEIAKAAGRAAVNIGIKITAVVGVGMVLYDLAKEIGFILSRSPDGTVKTEKADPAVCSVAPCFEYQGFNTGVWYPSLETAGQNSVGVKPVNCTGFSIYRKTLVSVTLPDTFTYRWAYCGNESEVSTATEVLPRRSATPTAPMYLPSNLQELEDAIAAKPGWPSGSAVRRLLAEDNPSSGEKVKTGPQTVTGPATTPGAQKVTQNTTNNTTKTENTTHNHTYAGPTITTTTVTVTNITNNSTGDTISSETTTATPVKEQEPATDACKDNPDRAGCVDLDTPEEKIPRETKTITYSEENVFGGGSCPTNLTATIATLGSTVTVWDWQKTCAAALPLRALVLALASFAALLIVMPGRVET